MTDKLLAIYNTLYKHYGPQYWWPGESPWEICVGAILTQNTNWRNVEKAIINLKKSNFISTTSKTPDCSIRLLNADNSVIEKLIRPSGYYRMKTKTLKNFALWWSNNVSEQKLKENPTINEIRPSLLSVNGIGPETADSILLYAFNLPTFVIDAYTKRIMTRHAQTDLNIKYNDLRELFMKNLPNNPNLFKEFHALFVQLAKESCLKNKCTHSCVLRCL